MGLLVQLHEPLSKAGVTMGVCRSLESCRGGPHIEVLALKHVGCKTQSNNYVDMMLL